MKAAQHSAKGTKGTVLIMAAGTGGHIFPALSIARNLQSRGYRTEWLGTPAGMEVDVLRNTDIVLHRIDARGLRGKNTLSVLGAPFMIARAIVQTLRVLKQVQPCCVLGMGGYVTGPGGVAAKLSGKPLLIHEQNAIAGLSNLLLFHFFCNQNFLLLTHDLHHLFNFGMQCAQFWRTLIDHYFT